jgi:hypothetical protein
MLVPGHVHTIVCVCVDGETQPLWDEKAFLTVPRPTCLVLTWDRLLLAPAMATGSVLSLYCFKTYIL